MTQSAKISTRILLTVFIVLAVIEYTFAEGEFVWQPVASMNTPRMSHAAVVFEDRIYVFGGRSLRPNQVLASIEVYNPDDDEWQVVDPLPRPLCCMTAIVDNSVIYLFGGMTDRNESVDWVLRYDPRNQTARTVNHLPRPLHSMSAINRNHFVFLMGGIDQRRLYLREGSIYNITRDEFSQAPQFNSPRALFGMVDLRTIWAVGGLAPGGPVISVESLRDDQWNNVSRMPEPRGDIGVCNFADSLIIVAGGINWEEMVSNRVDGYLIQQNQWIELPPLTNDRRSFPLVNLRDKVYAIGGVSRPQRQGEHLLDDVEKLVYDGGGFVLPDADQPENMKLSFVWPNPTNGTVHIRLPSPGLTIEIFNLHGNRLAGPTTVSSSVYTWNSAGSPAGTYFYVIEPIFVSPPITGTITVVK